MLSPGQWYKRVPKDPAKNVQFRKALILRANGDKAFQKAILHICSKDILFFINCFVWQTNPKKKGGDEVGPFITWPFQDRALLSEVHGKEGILWCNEHNEDLAVSKSREMGATWIFLLVMDWLCRFYPYHDSLMMSKSAVAVDGPSRQSLFGKMRFVHEHLPRWMHDPDKFRDQKNFFGYPGTNSSATGFASTGKAGVSERGSEFFFDEFSQVEEDWEVYHRTAATSGCRMFNGTHMGMGTAFYALTQDKSMKQIMFHWTQHPDKNKGLYRWNVKTQKPDYLEYHPETDTITLAKEITYPFPPDYEYDKTMNPTGGPHPGVRSPWYDKEFNRIGRNVSEMAKDQDINPSGSVAQFYNALIIRTLIEDYASEPFWVGEIKYDDEGNFIEFVEQEDGRFKLWLNLVNGRPPCSRYGAGTDVSGGTGKTSSCLSVLDCRTGEKVLSFKDPHIDPVEFGVLATAVCRLFSDENGEGAKLGWEHHGPGTQFGKRVWKVLGYRNIYFRPTKKGSLSEGLSDVPGVPVSLPSDQLELHTEYRNALTERRFLNRSKADLEETLAFKRDGNGGVTHTQYVNKDDPSSGKSNHGDPVIADAIACKMGVPEKSDLRKKEPDKILNELTLAGRREMARLQEQEAW